MSTEGMRRLLKAREVAAIFSVVDKTVDRWEKTEPLFPRRVPGLKQKRWWEDEVLQYLDYLRSLQPPREPPKRARGRPRKPR